MPEQVEDSFLSSKVRIRVSDLKEAKSRGEKWVMLTSYDTISARIFDHAKIPCLLIGDSAAQLVYGMKSTIPVTLDELIPLAKAVSSGASRALVIGDLPFGSYEESPAKALQSSARLMKEGGVEGIKLEGGKELAEHVKLLTLSGIPVFAHIGFTPQSEHLLGGFKIQGRGQDATMRLIADARALEEAGAVACVIEMVPAEAAKLITQALKIPTIGIGAGSYCDAQVLVWNDLVGFSAPKGSSSGSGSYLAESSGQAQSSVSNGELELERVPKFVKRYASVSQIIYDAVIKFSEDVRSGSYPDPEHSYK